MTRAIIAVMGAAVGDDLLRAGHDALATGDWGTARACFEQAAEIEETAEVLDGLSHAVHFQGDHARAIELKERAFAAYRRRGKRVEPAELARWLAFLHGAVHGNGAAANGWMARAESLLEDVEPCAAHGWLTLDRAPFTEDASERERLALAALAIARRFGDRDLEFGAMALLGDAYVASGRVAEGMTLLDETMAAVSGGEVAAIEAIREIFCRLLSACERAVDVRRAEQWLAVARRSVAWSDFAPPFCRSHYGGILIAIGRWDEAEEELLAAIRTLERGYRAQRTLPLVRLADLRVRQGRFEEAERLLEDGEWHPAARRVLATIAWGRGELRLAEDHALLCLESEDPSDPAGVALLVLLVEVRLARGEQAAAEEAANALAGLATSSGDDRAAAWAEFAHGRVLAVQGGERAATRLQAALEGFAALDLPFEAARARLELARTLVPTAPAAAWPRRGSRSRRSSSSAPCATPTERPTCSAGSAPAGARGLDATGR